MAEPFRRLLLGNRHLASQGEGSATIDGESVPTLLAIDPVKRSVYPPLLQGHPPRADNQIVLGTQTLGGSTDRSARRCRSPPARPSHLGHRWSHDPPSVGDLFSNQLGEGAWVYGPAVLKQQAEQAQGSSATPPTVFNMFTVRYARGVSPPVAFDSLQRDFGAIVLRRLPSEDVLNLQQRSIACRSSSPPWLRCLGSRRSAIH